jgi:2-C-methyl-D-erythritol 4-phosphate cytidylyltransferase
MTFEAIATSAIVLAAGSGSRMGTPNNKVFLDLGGVSILEHSLSLFATLPFIREIVLVVRPADRAWIAQHYQNRLEELGVSTVVDGGDRRADSARRGIEACSATTKLLLIHDAARPFPTAASVEACVRAAAQQGVAILAVPVEDTLKTSVDGLQVSGTVPRQGLYRAQTPQVFRRDILAKVLAAVGDQDFTDDAAMAEAAGISVALVPGQETNIKITTPGHLSLARAIFRLERNEIDEGQAPPAAPNRDRI